MSDSYSDWSDDSRESSEEKGRRVAATMWVCFALIAIIALIVAVVVSIFGWPWNWKTSKHTIKHYRLPRNLKPESYDLVIKTYLPAYKDVPKSRELSFDGQMAILIEASSSTDRIALHMKHISIIKSESSVIFGDTVIPIKKISFLKSADVGIFHLAKNVIKGQKFMLRITYIGTIGIDRMTGLYLTNYTEDGEKKVAAVTKFEPTHAREMMPCFDEPDFKATWNIAVIHPYKTTAISNGMELSSEVDSDRSWVTTKFETTPRMSSYLVAVFVSEFTSNHLETSSGVLFRVWSRPAATDMTSYALSTGVKCLAFFEKYFDIPFSLKKQDMIAVPDFQSGAMENWGMITYRESYLLYDERIFPHSSRFRVTKTIAHELSHSMARKGETTRVALPERQEKVST